MIKYDPFVERQFSPTFSGTKVPADKKEILLASANSDLAINGHLIDSEWDFCKYLVILNDIGVKCAVRPITLDIYPFIRTDYSQRTPDELPILTRFAQLPPGFKGQEANFIVFVLYSREQLLKEFKGDEFYFDEDVKWGVVSIMGTLEPNPDPLVPITIMRNALGTDEGGNGEKLNKKVYLESVEFWSKNILVK